MSEEKFYGLYRGKVVDNNDPDGRKRLKLRVPSVLDTAVTDWAWPCLPPTENHADHKQHILLNSASATAVGDHGSHTHTISVIDTNDAFEHNHTAVVLQNVDPVTVAPQHTRHKHVPGIGTEVWVMFEGGVPDYPVWIGVTT